jgi:hypothetical protein
MGYNPSFNLNPDQLELIENALRSEMGRLVKPKPENWNENCSKKEQAKDINELLGHLHGQKTWYKTDDNVPIG